MGEDCTLLALVAKWLCQKSVIRSSSGLRVVRRRNVQALSTWAIGRLPLSFRNDSTSISLPRSGRRVEKPLDRAFVAVGEVEVQFGLARAKAESAEEVRSSVPVAL